MGDFPRWVDREDVDSQAMYSAYLRYEFGRQQTHFRHADWRPVWWGQLDMIVHRVPHVPGMTLVRPDTKTVQERACEKERCPRCEARMGGYQFRWYSCYWTKTYNEVRRGGAWEAPEPAEEPVDDPSLRFWKRPDPPQM